MMHGIIAATKAESLAVDSARDKNPDRSVKLPSVKADACEMGGVASASLSF
jgi:hypothetical protein